MNAELTLPSVITRFVDNELVPYLVENQLAWKGDFEVLFDKYVREQLQKKDAVHLVARPKLRVSLAPKQRRKKTVSTPTSLQQRKPVIRLKETPSAGPMEVPPAPLSPTIPLPPPVLPPPGNEVAPPPPTSPSESLASSTTTATSVSSPTVSSQSHLVLEDDIFFSTTSAILPSMSASVEVTPEIVLKSQAAKSEFASLEVPLHELIESQEAFVTFMNDAVRTVPAALDTELPRPEEWREMSSKKGFLRRKRRSAALRKIDDALLQVWQQKSVCNSILHSTYLLLTDSAAGESASQSQITFSFPGLEVQSFVVGRCSVLPLGYLLTAFDDNMFSSAMNSHSVGKELMQASPDFTALYDLADTTLAKAQMMQSQKMILASLALAYFVHSQTRAQQHFGHGDRFFWSQVLSVQQWPSKDEDTSKNHEELGSFFASPHASFVVNPLLRGFQKLQHRVKDAVDHASIEEPDQAEEPLSEMADMSHTDRRALKFLLSPIKSKADQAGIEAAQSHAPLCEPVAAVWLLRRVLELRLRSLCDLLTALRSLAAERLATSGVSPVSPTGDGGSDGEEEHLLRLDAKEHSACDKLHSLAVKEVLELVRTLWRFPEYSTLEPVVHAVERARQAAIVNDKRMPTAAHILEIMRQQVADNYEELRRQQQGATSPEVRMIRFNVLALAEKESAKKKSTRSSSSIVAGEEAPARRRLTVLRTRSSGGSFS
ncbi:MAG: hypothetical protein MHM6MM_005617 [Cercozoa sp. M6MM]